MKPMNLIRAAAFTIVATLGFAAPSHAAVTAFFSSGATCGGAPIGAYTIGGGTFQVSLCVTVEPNESNNGFHGEHGCFEMRLIVFRPAFDPGNPCHPWSGPCPLE